MSELANPRPDLEPPAAQGTTGHARLDRDGSGGKHVEEPAEAPLRLLLVVDSLDGGGAEGHVVDLALSLRARGCDVTVACSVGGVLLPVLESSGIPVVCIVGCLVKRRFSVSFARGLRRLMSEHDYDLVHAHIYASAAACAVATVGTGVPLVITEHTEAPWRSAPARQLSRWSYGRAARIIAVSSAIERLLITVYGVPPPRVRFILPAPPPVRPPAGPPLPRKAPGALLVGRVARLQPEKGIDVFIRAAAHIAAACPRARFVVVGGGPLLGELEVLAEAIGVRDCVDFLGFRADARRLMEDLDVLVVSSISDGSPLVVLEAMAAGVPVVASAVGGIPDQIRHGREGLLVPPGDADALAGCVLELLEDPDLARRLKAAGRRRAAELSHARMVDRTRDVYAEALEALVSTAAGRRRT